MNPHVRRIRPLRLRPLLHLYPLIPLSPVLAVLYFLSFIRFPLFFLLLLLTINNVQNFSIPEAAVQAYLPHDQTINKICEYSPKIIVDDQTWEEEKAASKLIKEREECAAERRSILEDFKKLREHLIILLDANFTESANARLPVSEFDLDRDARARKIHDNIANKEQLIIKLEKEIFQRDQVAKYLRELCWDTMQIPACTLLSLHGKIRVDNFPIPCIARHHEECRKWERFVAGFKPQDDSRKIEMKIPENLLILGTTTHRWIKEVPHVSMENQIKKFSGYTEGIRVRTIVRDQERKLKIHFNKLFEEIRQVKEQELSVAAERIGEIKNRALELKNMFGIDYGKDDTMLQPLWHYSEKPETIISVEDSEIVAGRAATFLERDVREELMRREEEESAKLNDSFREDVLEIMMDGLLEVRSVHLV